MKRKVYGERHAPSHLVSSDSHESPFCKLLEATTKAKYPQIGGYTEEPNEVLNGIEPELYSVLSLHKEKLSFVTLLRPGARTECFGTKREWTSFLVTPNGAISHGAHKRRELWNESV